MTKLCDKHLGLYEKNRITEDVSAGLLNYSMDHAKDLEYRKEHMRGNVIFEDPEDPVGDDYINS